MRTTYAEKLALREQGLTYRKIAEMLGISHLAVAQALSKTEPSRFIWWNEKRCRYLGLRKWLNENKVSGMELVRRLGYVPCTTAYTRLSDRLSGRAEFKFSQIKALLELTGGTFEEMFG